MSEDAMHAEATDTGPAMPEEHPPADADDDNTFATAPDLDGTASDATLPDLDAMTADLDGVDAALARLADGTYWTDEITGEPIPDDVLTADPMARRA